MSRPHALRLVLPKDSPDPIEVPRSAVITLLPAAQNTIYYYEGDDPTKLKTADFTSIRNIILDKKRRTNPKWFEIVLKPTKDASYKNAVDILDEMKIDAVPHFALVDITPDEYRVIQETEQANGIH